MSKRWWGAIAMVLCTASAAPAAATASAATRAPSPPAREWRFRVFLDEKPIGEQIFRLTEDGSRSRVSIEADLEVKIFFLSAYSYRHRNEEVWEGDCLRSMTSQTDDNGTPFRVNGILEADGFVVQTATAHSTLPACVHSFAYWSLEDLRVPNLLNSQTGEYQAVSMHELGEEQRPFRGQTTSARGFALEGPGLRIDLWYAADNEWIALDSKTKSGRMLHYVRE
jgi:hypothetical protein